MGSEIEKYLYYLGRVNILCEYPYQIKFINSKLFIIDICNLD